MTMRRGGLLYRLVVSVAKLLFKLLYRHKVYGLEHLFEGGALLCSNHTSFWDPPILAISWPEEVHFLARETLFHVPLFGRFIHAINARPVSGGAKDIATFRTICKLLEEDKKVVLFPEGRRSENNTLAPFKSGISFFMLRTHKAIVPAYIAGAFEIWNRKRKFPKLWGKTACIFGSPLCFDEFAAMDKKEAEALIAKRLHAKILSLKTWFEKGAQGSPP